MTMPKSMRRMSQPGAKYRKPTAPLRGLPKLNTPTPGRVGKSLPNSVKPKVIRPLKPLTGLKKPVK